MGAVSVGVLLMASHASPVLDVQVEMYSMVTASLNGLCQAQVSRHLQRMAINTLQNQSCAGVQLR